MKGLIPRIVESVFDSVDRADPETEFTIQVSYIEIYLEKIRDLLDRKYLYLKAVVLLSVISSSYATEFKDQRRQTQWKGSIYPRCNRRICYISRRSVYIDERGSWKQNSFCNQNE